MPTGGLASWLVPLLWNTAASYAMNAITNKLFGPKAQNNSPTYSIGTLQTQTNSDMVMPIIYGRVKCAGNNLWQDGSGTTVKRLVGFGLGKNNSVSNVRLNDIPINAISFFTITYTSSEGYGRCRYTKNIFYLTTPSGTNSLDCTNKTSLELITWINSFSGWHATSENTFNVSDLKDINAKHTSMFTTWYGADCTNVTVSVTSDSLPKCSYTAYMGDGEQTIDNRVSGAMQADKAKLVGGLKYDSYLALTITASDKITGNPNVTAVWEGRIVKIYSTKATGGYTLDLKTGYFFKEEWSDNVWCVLDFMTSVDGCNIPIENIDIQSYITAAEYAQPTDNSRLWSVNLILDEKKSRQDWLNELLLCFRAYRTYQNGKHGILIDKPEPVSQVFTVKKTETIQIDWQELSEDIERIILKYRDPDYEWQNVGAPATMKAPYRNATYNDDGTVKSNGTPLSKTIEIHGITNFTQASQHSWFYLNQAQTCGEYITYACNKRALNRTIGDVIGIYNPITQVTEPGLPYKRYRIMAMTEPQGVQIQVYCREYNEALYTDQLGSVAPVVNLTKLPNPTVPPPDVLNIQIDQVYYRQKDGTIVSYITGTFDLPDSSMFGSAIVEYSEDDGQTWKYNSTVSVGEFIIDNVKTGVTYFVRIKSASRTPGIVSDGVTSGPILITGKDSPPPDIESLYVEKTATGMWRFIFTLSNPPVDLAGYKFKYNIGSSTFWDNAIDLHDGLVVASPFETNALRGGVFTVLVKAVDNSGNESEKPAVSLIGLGDEIVNNVIYEQDFKSAGFPGVKANCSVNSGLLIANDTGGSMYPADDKAPMYIANNAPFYAENWAAMTYEDSFIPDGDGTLTFSLVSDGNSQIFYRQRYPYPIYGCDGDLMFPDDTKLMYQEAPYIPYSGKVETNGNSIHDVRVVIGAGTTQGIVRELKALVDVEDEDEILNDISIPSSGIRLPVLKKYRLIKNVNITIQDSGDTVAIAFRLTDKNITGPFITLYDKDNTAVSGVIDAQIQGIKG